jgi:TetR/AcrR family transcriptional repressor of nem operon
VHGAMLSARAYGDPKTFAAIVQPVLDRLRARLSPVDGST